MPTIMDANRDEWPARSPDKTQILSLVSEPRNIHLTMSLVPA
jgi:hypothetical protein